MEAWMWLSIGLLFSVYLMSLFYGDCIMRRVDPINCGALYGSFTVDVGASRSVSNACDGRCQFLVKNLQEAVNKCNRDSCKEFYYEDGQMAYLDLNSPRVTNSDGGIYTRIGSIVR